MLTCSPLATGASYNAGNYSIQQLPPFEATASSYAFAINDVGQITGETYSAANNERSFIWDKTNGMLTLSVATEAEDWGSDINDNRQIAGSYVTASGEHHAFVWSPANGKRDLGTFNGYPTSAWGINASGEVVGYSTASNGQARAFLWNESTGLQDLGTLGGARSIALRITDAGQVVGFSTTVSGQSHAFYWEQGRGMIDVGTLGGADSDASDINASGQVVGGAYNANGEMRAYIWTEASGIRDLGTLPGTVHSYATAINNHGQVVGAARNTPVLRAILWTEEGGLVDLNTLFASQLVDGTSAPGFISLNEARDINDKGEIVGSGTYFDGTATYTRAFYLALSSVQPATFAEPALSGSTVTVDALGLAGNYYALYSSTNLIGNAASWTYAGATGQIAVNGTTTLSFTKGSGNEVFYRIVTSATPLDGVTINADAKYSTNVCAFYTISVPAGATRMVSMQVQKANYRVNTLFSAAPNGTSVSLYSRSGVAGAVSNKVSGVAWTNTTLAVSFGTIATVKAPAANPVNVTIAGVVEAGSWGHNLSANVDNYFAAYTPVSGLPSALGITKANNDKVSYLKNLDASWSNSSSTGTGSIWLPSIAAVKVGEAINYSPNASGRSFNEVLSLPTNSIVVVRAIQ